MTGNIKYTYLNPEFEKNEFLAMEHVKGLVDYICNLEEKKDLDHVFKIKHRLWVKHLKKSENERFSNGALKINCLTDAFCDYFWIKDDDEETDSSGSFEINKRILLRISSDLQDSLDHENSNGLLLQCIKTLDWGGVYRGSVKWVIQEFDNGTLLTTIKNARSILDGDSWSNANSFVRENLRMDSGLTKIYSLASKRSIIYDDRVGAAFGLLIRNYILERESKNVKFEEWFPKRDSTIIPRELYLMVGRELRRNPSLKNKKIVFPRHGQCGMDSHAYSNLLANWIVEDICLKLHEKGINMSLREVEAALFVLGYSVLDEHMKI